MKLIDEILYLLIIFIVVFFISLTAVLITIKKQKVIDIGSGKIYYIEKGGK